LSVQEADFIYLANISCCLLLFV